MGISLGDNHAAIHGYIAHHNTFINPLLRRHLDCQSLSFLLEKLFLIRLLLTNLQSLPPRPLKLPVLLFFNITNDGCFGLEIHECLVALEDDTALINTLYLTFILPRRTIKQRIRNMITLQRLINHLPLLLIRLPECSLGLFQQLKVLLGHGPLVIFMLQRTAFHFVEEVARLADILHKVLIRQLQRLHLKDQSLLLLLLFLVDRRHFRENIIHLSENQVRIEIDIMIVDLKHVEHPFQNIVEVDRQSHCRVDFFVGEDFRVFMDVLILILLQIQMIVKDE